MVAAEARPKKDVLDAFNLLARDEVDERLVAAQIIGGEVSAYSKRRLVKGMASSQDSARRGFSLALTTMLRNGNITAEEVKKLIGEELRLEGAPRESREARLGRIFCIAALQRSGVISKDGDLASWCVKNLCAAAGSEKGLGGASLSLAMEIYHEHKKKDTVRKEISTWSRKDSPEAFALKMIDEDVDMRAARETLSSWFNLGFSIRAPPACWRLAVEQSGRRGTLSKFWSTCVKDQLLTSKAIEKRRASLRLVPIALAACKTSADVAAVLQKDTVKNLTSAKIRSNELVEAVKRMDTGALLDVVLTLGALGGWDDVVIAAVERMKTSDVKKLIAAGKKWDKTQAVPMLSCIWRAYGNWHEGAAKAMAELDSGPALVRLAADTDVDTVFKLYELLTGNSVELQDGAGQRRERAEEVLDRGLELCADENVEGETAVEKIVSMIQVPSAPLRSLATLAWNVLVPVLSWSDLDPLVELMLRGGGEEGLEENDDELDGEFEGEGNESSDEEQDRDDDDDDNDNEDGDDDEDDNDDYVDDDEEDEEDGSRKTSFVGMTTNNEDIDVEMDMDKEDPAVLAQYDRMLSSLMQNYKETSTARRKKANELRAQTRMKALDLLSQFIASARKRHVETEAVIRLINPLLTVAVEGNKVGDRVEVLLSRKVLRSPKELSTCDDEVLQETIKDVIDLASKPSAHVRAHICGKVMSFLFSVAMKSSVNKDFLVEEFRRAWTCFSTIKRNTGIESSWCEAIAQQVPEIVLEASNLIRTTAVEGRTPFVRGVSLGTFMIALKSNAQKGVPRKEKRDKKLLGVLLSVRHVPSAKVVDRIFLCDFLTISSSGDNSALQKGYKAAEDSFCLSVHAKGTFKLIRLKEVVALGLELLKLEGCDKNLDAIRDAVDHLASRDECTSNNNFGFVVQRLQTELEDGKGGWRNKSKSKRQLAEDSGSDGQNLVQVTKRSKRAEKQEAEE